MSSFSEAPRGLSPFCILYLTSGVPQEPDRGVLSVPEVQLLTRGDVCNYSPEAMDRAA